MVRACFLLFGLTCLAAFAGALKDHSLDDLKAVETSADETRRHAEHSTLGENDAASAHLVSQRVRSRKVVRQSRPTGSIRALHKSTAAAFPILRRQADVVQEANGNKSVDDDEDRKTLSQQVADGKYGLIQKEIFNKALHRPGIISYEVNPEVPKDNVNNLGGLRANDIWLAENHLLVLSGGGFQEKEPSTPVWPPIDNYNAPLRQVKIPANPKVPPPFPVQLKEDGPVEFIRNENGTGGPPPFPPFFPPPFPPPGEGNSENITLYPYPPPNFNPGNFSPGNGPFLLPPPPFPFFPPPPGNQNISLFLPPPGFFPGIPPGAAFLPPPGNLTDQIDEDDPSLYYPPPYDFYYPRDNSSIVPPGPLVPGIVLPPPPNFFAPLLNTTNGASKTTTSNIEGSGLQHLTKDELLTPEKKTGPVTILTSTETPTVTDDYNIFTTPAPVYYTTDIPTTPAYTTNTDNSLQDVTQPSIQHALPPNAVVQEWVPIPAPRPFYITGPRKPLRKGTTTTLPPDYNSVSPPAEYLNGYLYNTPKTQHRLQEEGWILPNKTNNYEQELQYFKEMTESPKDYYDYYPGSNPLLNQYLTQSLLQRKLRPLTKGVGGSISPIRGYSQPGRGGKGKSLKATYYFYEEPHIVQSQLTDADDIKYEDASYRSTTPAPPSQYFNPARGNPRVNYESLLRTTTVPNVKSADVSYYYPDSYVNVKQPQLSNENPVNYFQYSGDFKPSPIEIPAKVFKSSGAGQTVYEYSFTAPGYSGQPSKIGTPQKPAVPPVEQTNANPPLVQSQPLQQYNRYEYQSTPAAQPVYNYNQPVFTTVSPIKQQYFTPAGPTYKPLPGGIPHYQGFTTENQANAYYTTTPRPESNIATHTENPYHAFFTPQDAGLIDDITKKYFTSFGQKLNKDSVGGEPVTTPLPPDDVARKAQYHPAALKLIDQSQKLRFPEDRYPGYYTTPATTYRQKQYGYARPSKPVYSYNYDNNRKPVSLHSDILVNYRQPLPPLNPDAEFIDPNTPNIAKQPGKQQPLISYSLPGNGGHYYFLPPQAVQSDNYDRYENDGGYVYPSPTDTNQGYYKRNAKAPAQRIRQ